MDRPIVVPRNLSTSTLFDTTSSPYLSKKFMTELEEPNVEPVITERKILREIPMQCVLIGHVH